MFSTSHLLHLAAAARLAALDREREEMWKRRLPERDINGRRILPPANAEKAADDVFVHDPLQVLMGEVEA